MSTTEERRAQITEWSRGVNWYQMPVVICVGYTEDKPWEVLREYRTDVTVIMFEPDEELARRVGKTLPDDRTIIASHLTDLRSVVSSKCVAGAKPPDVIGVPDMAKTWGQLVVDAVGQGWRAKRSIDITMRQKNKMWTDIGLELLPKIVGKSLVNGMPADTLKGHPAIIVGAGPSLEKNVDLLKELKGRACIFATNSAVGVLEDHGVQPDVICAVEASTISLGPILESKLWPEAVLIPNLHTHPSLYDVPSRAVIPAVTPVGPVGVWLTLEYNLQPYTTGGSVSTLAYSVARGLGAGPIILVGMDCAQGTDGRNAYADGVRHADKTNDQQENLAFFDTVPAWGGVGFVKAPPYLSSFREWFENRARQHQQLKTMEPLINATEGGAQIQDSVEKRLFEVMQDLPEQDVDFGEMLMNAKGTVVGSDKVIDGLRKQMGELSKKPADLAAEGVRKIEELTKLVADVIEACDNSYLLSAYSLGPLEEMGMMPTGDQFKVMATAFNRTANNRPELNGKIEKTIAEILKQEEKQNAA